MELWGPRTRASPQLRGVRARGGAEARGMKAAAPPLPRAAATLFAALALLVAGAQPARAASPGGIEYGETSQAPSPPGAAEDSPGGVDPAQPLPEPPAEPAKPVPPPNEGQIARVLPSGLAVAPAGAPATVLAIIAAGNRIATKKYLWGGGHRRWEDRGYDCSGSVSYALHGGGLLERPLISGDFIRWGEAGPGRWVTIHANRGHVYMVVAGLRFDTSGQRRAGTRWQAAPRSSRRLRVRHPAGL